MIVAYLLALVIGVDPSKEPPTILHPYDTVDQCLVKAEKLNLGTVGTPGSLSTGTLHYCVRVVFPV